jgi:translation initiation factor eIF-2B subunit beta
MEYFKRIENIDSIKELKRKLRKKKDMNSTEISKHVASLFYDLIQNSINEKTITTHSQLINLVSYFSKVFTAIDPVQFCIGNTIKRILHIIREVIKTNNEDQNKDILTNKIEEAKKNMKLLKNFDFTQINKKDNEENKETQNEKEELNDPITESDKDKILEEIGNIISEIESISQTIIDQKEIKDLIAEGDIILTSNYSQQVVEILAENAKTKKFKVFVCESAPLLREKSQAEELRKRKLDTVVIEDDDIYSVMNKFTKVKVLLGAKAILVNGGLVTYGGAYNICLLASMFSNPVIIAGGTTKLTPMYSFKHELYNEYLSPDLILGKNMDYQGDISSIQFNNPSLDYVPPNLITMYATDIGILNPNYLYKNFNEMYDLEDYEI